MPRSSFFFPLRTNATYLGRPEGAAQLEATIKQASILYDELIFEGGLYEAAILPTNKFEIFHPPDKLTDETLRTAHSSSKLTNGPFAVTFTGNDGQTFTVSGDTIARFSSEYHTVLRTLPATNIPWMKVQNFELTDEGKADVKGLEGILQSALGPAISPDEHFLRRTLVSNFARDLTVIQSLEAAACLHSEYASLLAHHLHLVSAPGFTALQIAVPNLSEVHWEDILKLRERDSLIEFRQKLVSFEDYVRAALPEGAMDEIQHERALTQAWIDELIREISSLRPKTGEAIVSTALDLLLGPFPGLSTAVNAYVNTANIVRDKRTWIAAYLELRKTD